MDISAIKVVGITGRKRAGKDTLALGLVKQENYVRLAYADHLYQELAEAFDVSTVFLNTDATKESMQVELAVERCRHAEFKAFCLDQLQLSPAYLFSPRELLQKYGTEFRRVFQKQPRYWLDHLERDLQHWALKGQIQFAIADVRFPDEVEHIETGFGGLVVRIIRPSQPPSADRHVSETALDGYVFPVVFNHENAPVSDLVDQCLSLLPV